MRQAIQVVLGTIAQRQAIDPLPQQFAQRIANQVRLPRVGQLIGKRIDQPQAMIGFPQQHRSAIGGEPIIASLDLDRTIERGLEKRPLAFTHHVNLLARIGASQSTATDSQISDKSSGEQEGVREQYGLINYSKKRRRQPIGSIATRPVRWRPLTPPSPST